MDLLNNIYFSGSILMILLSLPMIFRRVPPNPLYGFRTRATLSDPDLWYAANAYAGKWLLADGLLFLLVVSAMRLFFSFSVDVFSTIAAVVMLGSLTVTVIFCLRYTKIR